MSISLHDHTKKIFKVENQRTLEAKLSQEDNLEDEIIHILVSELIAHGKDINQIRQISQISKILGQSLGLGVKYCDRLEQAAKIYDIGNIMIAREVYEKEDKLSFEEFEIVKNHTLLGHNLLISKGFPITDLAAIISAEHHEWWNGKGYPRQFESSEIDIASRIVAVADTVGALFRKRPGRKVWSYKKILTYIKKRSGLQFDPDVIDVFLINQEAIHEVLLTDLESTPSWYI